MDRDSALPDETYSGLMLAAVLESCDEAVLSLGLDGTVMSWSKAAERIFGYTPQEIVGRSVFLLVPEDLHEETVRTYTRVLAGDRIEHLETVRLTKDGIRLDVSLTASPIRDSAGRIIGLAKIVYDISDRGKMQRQLLESEKFASAGRMAATIAHEINNPLESVMNLIYLARVQGSLDGKANEYLMTAEQEIERVSHIARQTLGYYRDNAGPTKVYFHELVEDVLKIYSVMLHSAGIRVECRFDDRKLIEVNRGEMLQVISNIVANSIDAMPAGGALEIHVAAAATREQAGVRIVIRDDGIGIEQKDLRKVFDPFFTTKGDRGTGIGLWVARELVERRRGNIAMTSSTDAAHSGTTTSIFIPFANQATSGEPAHATAA
ncbi:MAG TPA: PAS domain S-box protein [Edaphobacter sp.]